MVFTIVFNFGLKASSDEFLSVEEKPKAGTMSPSISSGEFFSFLASPTSAAVNSRDLSFSLTFAQMLKGPGCLPSSMMEDEESGSVAAAESSIYEFSQVSFHMREAWG